MSPVYWQGFGTNFIYYEHGNTSTYWYSDNGTTVNPSPLGSNSLTEDDRGGGISLSANGTTNGILWDQDTDGGIYERIMRSIFRRSYGARAWVGGRGRIARR